MFTFGLGYKLKFGTKIEDGTLDVAEGYQLCVCLTSVDTIEKPTADERYSINLLKALHEAAWDQMAEECERDPQVVPDVVISCFAGANLKGKVNKNRAVKPMFSYPKKETGKGIKVDDTSKPLRTYFPLMTYGKGRKMKNKTLIYGPGDQKKSPESIFGKRGTVHLVLRCEDVYWGSHSDASYTASVRLKINDMNWIPQKTVEPKRHLGKNTAPIEENDESDNENREDDSFHNPKGNDEQDSGFINKDDEDPEKVLNEGGETDEEPPPPKKVKTSTAADKRKAHLAKKKVNKKKNE
jgi:hypothetical protein